MILILMGVSGVGKTTIGKILAERTGWQFEDADDYHPESNREKMASGIPLTDADRRPWLAVLNGLLANYLQQEKSAILACSALKSTYREQLTQGLGMGKVQFVALHAPVQVLRERIHARSHQYMNPNLLDSQLATLEESSTAWPVSVEGTPEQTVNEIFKRLQASGFAA